MTLSLRHPLSDHPALFVTGTDTDVGKTVIGVTLALQWVRRGHEVCAIKAVAAGGRKNRAGRFITEDAEALARAGTPKGMDVYTQTLGLAPGEPLVGLRRAMAPYSAALLEKSPLDFAALVRRLRKLQGACADARVRLLIEGAGGALVPLARGKTMADLIATLAIPTVIVARTELGTINHTLLTVEALRSRGVSIAAVILSRRRQGVYTEVEKAAFREIPMFLPRGLPLLLAGRARPGQPAPLRTL